MIYMVVAMANKNVIGKNNDLLWHIPEDLKYFKSLTIGKNIIMGSNTYKSIMKYTKGKPLPDRKNIVLTKNKTQFSNYDVEGVVFFEDVQDVIELSKKEDVYIIGGGTIYQEFFKYADFLHITKIYFDFDGDTFFPNIKEEDWEIITKIKNKNNDFEFDFINFKRKKYE